MLAINLSLIACLCWGLSQFLAGSQARTLPVLTLLAYTTPTTQGMLSLVAVVSSLYPVVSVVLAAVFLKERLRGFQRIGVVLIILGIAMIST